MGGDGAGQVGLERGFRREGGGDAPLAPADEFCGGVVGGEAFGVAGEGVGVVQGEAAAEAAVFEEGAELLVVVEEMAADGEELVFGGHVEAGGEDELCAAEVEVESGAGGFLHSGAAPPCGDVLLVGGLVGGEADIAIDAQHDAVGRADVMRGVVGHGGGDGLDEGEHGGFDFALVNGAAGLEPLAAIVTAEAAEEAQCFIVEMGDGVIGVSGLRVSRGHRIIITVPCCDLVRAGLQGVHKRANGLPGRVARGADGAVMKQYLGWAVIAVLLAAGPAGHAQAGRLLTQGQARELARLVAGHEQIDVSSEWIEFDSMDAGAPYLPGFASFVVMREAQKPGPDTTLRRYAVNRTSGNVWEMTLCRKYEFPALAALRKKLTGHAEAGKAADAAERKELGCLPGKSAGQRVSGSARRR